MNTDTFSRLLYRYWFYGWLFHDVSRGNLFEQAAAKQHNRELSRWLPIYLLRWTVLGALCYAGGLCIESMMSAPVAWLPYTLSSLTLPVNAVTLAAWVGLKWMPLP
jgi:hypothetical protein